MSDRARVTRRRDVVHGVPCVEGTRIPAKSVVRICREGGDLVNGPMWYPNLTDAQVEAALSYWRRWGWWWEARWRLARAVDVVADRVAGWLMRGVW